MTPRHKLLSGLIAAIAVCCFTQFGFAQTYYQNQPVYQAPPVYSHPTPTTVWNNNSPCQTVVTPSQQGCNCGCGGSTGCVENPGNCDLVVTPGVLWSNKKTEKICVDPPTDCECITTNIKFYEKDVPCDGWIDVPTKIVECREQFRFERKTFSVCGCKVTVCIPCAIDYISCEKCEPRRKKVKLVARVRTEPSTGERRADIWAYNIQGLPSKAVLALNVTASVASKKFETNFNY